MQLYYMWNGGTIVNRILRVTTFITQSFLHWQSEWLEGKHRSFPSLCQFSNHIHRNTTSVLCLILGCMPRHSTVYLFIIWLYLRYLCFCHSFTCLSLGFCMTTSLPKNLSHLKVMLHSGSYFTHRALRSKASSCDSTWKQYLWSLVQFFTF